MRLECVPRRRRPVRVKVGARQYCRVAYNTARLLDRIPFEVVALKRQEAGFIVMLVNAPQPICRSLCVPLARRLIERPTIVVLHDLPQPEWRTGRFTRPDVGGTMKPIVALERPRTSSVPTLDCLPHSVKHCRANAGVQTLEPQPPIGVVIDVFEGVPP